MKRGRPIVKKKYDAIDFMITGECDRKEFNRLTQYEQMMIIAQFGKDYLGAVRFIHISKVKNETSRV